MTYCHPFPPSTLPPVLTLNYRRVQLYSSCARARVHIRNRARVTFGQTRRSGECEPGLVHFPRRDCVSQGPGLIRKRTRGARRTFTQRLSTTKPKTIGANVLRAHRLCTEKLIERRCQGKQPGPRVYSRPASVPTKSRAWSLSGQRGTERLSVMVAATMRRPGDSTHRSFQLAAR